MFVCFSVFLIYFTLISAYDRGGHNSDIQVEAYRYGDYYFNFYFVSANWDEAVAICKASSSRLAVVHNIDRAKFLAETLAHTIVGVEDVWIGARFIADIWQWVPIRRLLPSETVDGFPPWLNYPTKRGKYCLSLDRRQHSQPIFVELQCFLQRPFICEKTAVAHLTVKPTLTTKIQINASTFTVYYGRVTWEESLTFCKQTGAHLAVVSNIDIANQLVSIMHHLRPAIRNAWIGARKQNHGWTWTSTENHLPREKDLESEYPPWANEDDTNDRVFKDCLVLDHHVCKSNRLQGNYGIQKSCNEKAIFFGETCTLKKDFICEFVSQQKKSSSDKGEVIMDGKITYIYSKERHSWKSAVQVCNALNMILAIPANKDELNAIITHLADVEYAWDHIWLGAKWDIIHNQWEWLNKTAIFNNISYLPWCSSVPKHEDNENCLNLDRDAHKIPIVYGLNCSIPQGFVCQFMPEEKFPVSESSELNKFVIHYFSLTHTDAEEACELHKSHLAITNTMELAQNLSFLLPVDTPVWVGGERINSVWQWSRIKEAISDLSDNSSYPPWGIPTTIEGRVCLAVQSGFRRYPQFLEMPCNTPSFFACEHGPESLPEPDVITTYNDNTYYFFQQQETWTKADSYCTYSHLQLPKIGNLELAHFLSEITGDEHPWWVGAKHAPNESWYWTSTGQRISAKIINTSWFNTNNSDNTVDECLILLDGANTEKFTGKACDEKHSFICVNSPNTRQQRHVIRKHGTEFDIQQNLANLINSKKYCEDQGMEVINITENINLIKALMQEKKLKSLWMNILRKGNGKWTYEDTDTEFHSDIKFPMKTKVYENGEKKDCAMLALKANDKLEIRRSDCNDFSFIVCQKNVENKTYSDAQSQEEMETAISNTLKLIASLKGRTHVQAKTFCKDLGGSIIIEPLYGAATNFFKTLSSDFLRFWIDKTHTATRFGNAVFIDKPRNNRLFIPLEHKQNPCFAYSRSKHKNLTIDCKEKLSTICYLESTPCKAPPIVNNLKWSPQSCNKDEIATGKVCKAACYKGQLFGPEKTVCVKGNWKYRSFSVNPTKCLTTNDQSQNLLQFLTSYVIKKRSPKIPFIFVIDNGASEFLFKISIAFVKHVVNIILLDQHRQASVVMYSKQVQTALNFYTYDTCDFTEKLKFIAANKHSFSPDYFKVLDNINTIVEKQNFNQIILIFFALRKDSGPASERINKIRELQERGVIIIVVSVHSGMNRAALEDMASVSNGDLLLYLFKNEKALQECGNFLQQHKNPTVNDCIFDKQARP